MNEKNLKQKASLNPKYYCNYSSNEMCAQELYDYQNIDLYVFKASPPDSREFRTNSQIELQNYWNIGIL
jgi:hypothetical protein